MTEEGQGRSVLVRDLGPDERPRERLSRHGPASLSDAEVLAILLGSGTRGESVLDLSRRVLESLGGLAGLSRADTLALNRIRGIGPARAAVLSAAAEAGRRVAAVAPSDRPRLTTPEGAFAFLSPRLRSKATEELVVLSLDARARPIAPPHVIRGGARAVGARPADVLREPMVLRAVSMLVAHNHPSGDPTPSSQDVALTGTLVDAGRMLDLDLLDHIVVGDGGFVSMRREGLGFTTARSAPRAPAG
ncbi:MAG: DNA repair protein RadC [Dehalococcoidia bacterium]